MTDKEKVINRIETICNTCKENTWRTEFTGDTIYPLLQDAVSTMKEQEKEIKALRLLVEWATDCDFGFDQFPEEYERYKDEITDMEYIDGMIHVAKRTLEDHGVFEEGW